MSHRAGGRQNQATDGPQNGGKRDRRDRREEPRIHPLGQQWSSHVLFADVQSPAGHRAETQIKRQHVKQTNAGDPNDGALASTAGILHGVVANQNVRQRSRTTEQGQHQRQEVDLVEELLTANPLERWMFAGSQDFGSGRNFGIVNSGLGLIRVDYFFVSPQHHFAPLQRLEEVYCRQRTGFGLPVRQLHNMTNRVQFRFALLFSLLLAVDEDCPVCTFGQRLHLGQLEIRAFFLRQLFRHPDGDQLSLPVLQTDILFVEFLPAIVCWQHVNIVADPNFAIVVGQIIRGDAECLELMTIISALLNLEPSLQNHPRQNRTEDNEQRSFEELHPCG